MIPLTAEEAGDALGVAPLVSPVTGVSIDSRSLRTGDLFVALRGERFDGHDFVAAAFAAGASGAVVERGVWAPTGGGLEPQKDGANTRLTIDPQRVYPVEDTLAALGSLARMVRRKSGVTVFAVTGSAGKTTTKDLLAAMVGRVRRVLATAENQNNEVGVPLTLLGIEPETEAVIVEMGMRGLGQIAALAQVAEPDVGIITNIYPVHLEILETTENVARAKTELLAALRPGGVAVVPCECDVLEPFVASLSCRKVEFSATTEASGARFRGWLEPAEGDLGYVLTLVWPNSQVRIETSYISKHGVENVIAAAAACYAAGLPVGECAQGVKDVRLTGGRGEARDAPGLCVIDDTYNANPAAVRAALDHLMHLASARGGRAVAVLGDMLELGEESERYHAEIGAYAAEIGVQALWGVGERARALVHGFQAKAETLERAGSARSAGHVGSAEETSSVVAGLRPGDVVLFKASRGMRLETMVDRVIAAAESGLWSPGDDAVANDVGKTRETGPC